MSYEVIIYRDLTLDSRAVSMWKKTELDATDLAKGDLGMSKEIVFIHDEKATVETVLPRLPNEPVEFVRVEAKGGRVVARGFINEDLHRGIGPEIVAEATAPNASAALRRLATIDPDSAETIAIRFCAQRPVDDLAEGIAFGLAARSSDASLDATARYSRSSTSPMQSRGRCPATLQRLHCLEPIVRCKQRTA